MSNLDSSIEGLASCLLDSRVEKIKEVAKNRTKYLTVVLENVYYTQNVSAIVRTCECFGLCDIYKVGLSEQGRLNKHVARGSSSWINIYDNSLSPVKEVLTGLKKSGYRIICAMPSLSAKSIYDVDLKISPVALVMGNEKDGASREAMECADEFVTIPMFGFTESFNISVSTAIILSEFIRKLRQSDIEWLLKEEEYKKLIYEWIKKSLKNSDEIEKFLERRLNHPNAQ